MSAALSFNALLSEFVTDLSMTFTEYPQLKMIQENLTNILSLDESNLIPAQLFQSVVTPHVEMISNRDTGLFDKIKFPESIRQNENKVELRTLYESSDQDTQNAIWDYLQQLTTISKTVQGFPPETLTSIEKLVKTVLSKIESGEINAEHAQNPLYIVQEMAQDPVVMDTLRQLTEM